MTQNQQTRLFMAARDLERALGARGIDEQELLTRMGTVRYEIDCLQRSLVAQHSRGAVARRAGFIYQ